LAGETPESIRIAEAAVQQAQAAYDKAVSDVESTKRTVEDEYQVATIALDTAQKNLTNSGASLDQAVRDSYESTRTKLRGLLGDAQTALTDGDTIIGVDNTAANDQFEATLGLNDRPSFDRAKMLYPGAKAAYQSALVRVNALTSSSPASEIKASAELTRSALQQVQAYLDQVQRTLAGTITSPSLSESQLATKRSTIDADRAAVSANLTTITTSLQAIQTAELSQTTTRAQLQNALETAQTNLRKADTNRTTNVLTAQSNVSIQLAALNSAKASLALKKAPPRAVDVAALRAQVLDAETAFAQANDRLNDGRIVAPVDGTIAEIIPSLGQQMGAGQVVIQLVAAEGYTVEALVPEADIAKVNVGQTATMTLDAFGDSVVFQGTVVAENPDQTKVQDAIYYKTSFQLLANGYDVKPGMTANVTIKTGESKDALFIPTRAVRDQNGVVSVRVLENAQPRDVNVQLGLRGDEGKVEVKEGLSVGQQVILGELTADEYKKLQATK
jgi:RND family efflux transporter MFP subunit